MLWMKKKPKVKKLTLPQIESLHQVIKDEIVETQTLQEIVALLVEEKRVEEVWKHFCSEKIEKFDAFEVILFMERFLEVNAIREYHSIVGRVKHGG